MLLADGARVISVSRSSYPELEARGVRCVRADLADAADADALGAAMEGAEVVFHVAARAGYWGPRAAYWEANVEGTRNVLAACRAAGVGRLVYTSSPSVCFDGRDHLEASNDLPYARRFLAAYPASKAAAEALVLEADGSDLATVALRPHLIFGPRDPHLVPRLVARARAGRLSVVGDGRNRVGLTYVDNAAHAHLCAARALKPGAPCAGRAYFVTNGESVVLWKWITALLERLGVAPPRRRIPLAAARSVGALAELLWRGLRLSGEPPMTRFVALQLATTHTYDMQPTRRDLGYTELVGMTEATERLVADLTR
jgi:nucleoside-diphosphate-sugar epimerase